MTTTVANASGPRKPSRWSQEAIQARDEAKRRLAAAYMLCRDREVARAMSETGQLDNATGVDDAAVKRSFSKASDWTYRAGLVEHCGRVKVAYSGGYPVLTGAGLCVASVASCGQRHCVACASEFARRNAKRVRDRLVVLDGYAQQARTGALVGVMQKKLDAATNALETMQRHAPVRVGFAAEIARRDEVRTVAEERARRIEEHEQRIARLDDWQAAEDDGWWRVEGDDHVARLAREYGVSEQELLREMGPDVDDLDDDAPDVGDGPGNRTSWAVLMRSAAKAKAKAKAAVARAVEQVAADKALRDAEAQHGRARAAEKRLAKFADELQAKLDDECCPLDHLTTRDKGRVPALIRRAEEGEQRAITSLLRLHAEGTAKHEHKLRTAYAKAAKALAVQLDDADLARVHARRLAARSGLYRARDVRLVTLTQKMVEGEAPGDAIARLRTSLLALGRSDDWRDHAAGAVWKIEAEYSTPDTRRAKARRHRARAEGLRAFAATASTTRAASSLRLAAELEQSADRLDARASWSSSGSGWHVHAHALVSCGYWRQADLVAAWREAAGTADVFADIRQPDGMTDMRGDASSAAVLDALREVTKYLTKPMSAREVPLDQFAQLIAATQGKRMLWTTGCFRGVDLVDYTQPDEEIVNGPDETLGVIGTAGTRVVTSWEQVEWRDDLDATTEFYIRQREHEERRPPPKPTGIADAFVSSVFA